MTHPLGKRGNIKKKQTNVGRKWDESTKENSKTKIDIIRIQQIREACGIQPINERRGGE